MQMNQAHFSYDLLSPLSEPWAYSVFAVHCISSLVCIFVSVYFFRKQKGAWWLLVAVAFLLPLLGYTIESAAHGLPPLPYGVTSPFQQLPPTDKDDGSTTFTRTTDVTISLDTVTPIMACALIWAYFADRKQTLRSASP
jgi:hypothetical protein